MTAASYTTDLSDIDDAETVTDWDESSNSAWDDGGGPDAEADYFIQGSGCVSEILKTGIGSLIYDNTSGITFNTGDVVMAWHYNQAPNALGTLAQGGIRQIIGSGYGDFYAWSVLGSDTYEYGGWRCIPVDPTVTVDYTVGSPTTTKRYFGSAHNQTGNVFKGNPHGIDVMRYGRAEAIIEYGDLSNGYATFAGFAAVNDNTSYRWGLIQEIQGGYLWQGLMSLGTSTNAVDFRDSNVAISVNDTIKVTSSFNKIEINNSSSRVDWDSIVITALGTTSPGTFEIIDDCDVNFSNSSFVGMGTFTFKTSASVVNCTFRNGLQITQGGATVDGCTFSGITSAVSLNVSDLDKIDNCKFISDGSNHAMELTTAHAGNSYTLTNCTYTGYATSNGSTGNECIYNNSQGAVTINVAAGDEPTIRNGTNASTIVIVNPVTLKVTVKDLFTSTVIESARVLVWATDNSNYFYQASVTIAGSGTTATVTHTAHGLQTTDNIIIQGANEDEFNGAYTVTVTNANVYTYTTSETVTVSNATGTILATFAFLNESTNSSGVAEDSRSLNNNQAISGWVRKSTSSPYYQQGSISGEISSTAGLSITTQLVRDE